MIPPRIYSIEYDSGGFILNKDLFSANERTGILSILPVMLVFAVIGMIVTLIATFLLAILISKGVLSEASHTITALCCIPGTFVTSLLTAKRVGRRILPMGLLSGALFFILLLLISILFLPEFDTWSGILQTLAACAGGSAAGALCTLGFRQR